MAVQYIYVAVAQGGEFEPAGVIAFNKDVGVAGFQYLSEYKGAPIDPINLNYEATGNRLFKVNQQFNTEMLHRVFQDHLPGAWGMNVMMAEHPALKSMTAAEKLAFFGNRTVGGLSCRVGNAAKTEYPNSGMDRLAEIRQQSVELFNKQLLAIKNKNVLWGLYSHGGARPKTSFVDAEGDHWLVKFNLESDGFNSARVEHALAVMGKRAGLDIVETKVETLHDGEDVLFVKRFDRVTVPKTGLLVGRMPESGEFRHHQISLFAMLDETRVRQPNGADYLDLNKVIRQASVDPQEDGRRLFTQMLYNIAVNNTDDHAKNFVMLLGKDGYRLSPAFDVTTNIYPYPHSTSVCGLPRAELDDRSVLGMASKMGVDAGIALAIKNQIMTAISDWPQIASQCGVSESDIARIADMFYGAKARQRDFSSASSYTPD